MSEVGLAEVVRALRAELEDAMQAADGERVRFEAKAIELEFQVGVTRTSEGRGGIRFWVLELGGAASHGSESIQRVSLSLEPVLASGDRVRITRSAQPPE